MKRLLTACALSFCFSALCGLARAETIRIWADQFRDIYSANADGTKTLFKTPRGVGVESLHGSGEWWYPVAIPVGKTITEVVYYHHSYGVGPTAASTGLVLTGNVLGSYSQPLFASGSCNANTGEYGAQRVVAPIAAAYRPLTIKTGWRYYVIICADPGAAVTGVKITYQ
jgi:hypothetical protein